MINEDIARKAASAMKAIHLARLPGMDLTAIKLNLAPTHAEVRTALRWQLALELAASDYIRPLDIAKTLLERLPHER